MSERGAVGRGRGGGGEGLSRGGGFVGGASARGGQRGRYQGSAAGSRGGRDGPRERITHPVGAKLLEEKIDEYEPQELLFWLTADRGVEVLLGTSSPRDDSRRLLLAAVEKACTSERSETLNHLLISVRDSAMFKGLSEHLSTVYIPSTSENLKHAESRQNLTELVEILLELLSHLMTSLPTDSASSASLLLPVIETRIVPALQLQRVKGDILRIKDMVEDSIRSKAEESEQSIPSSRRKQDEEEPPDNFREINIVPTVDDLNNFKPFLRQNKIDEKFKNLDSYLDIQFRLLREDFVRPLREGIREFRENGARTSRDIKVYHGVRILFPDMTPQVHAQYYVFLYRVRSPRALPTRSNLVWTDSVASAGRTPNVSSMAPSSASPMTASPAFSLGLLPIATRKISKRAGLTCFFKAPLIPIFAYRGPTLW